MEHTPQNKNLEAKLLSVKKVATLVFKQNGADEVRASQLAGLLVEFLKTKVAGEKLLLRGKVKTFWGELNGSALKNALMETYGSRAEGGNNNKPLAVFRTVIEMAANNFTSTDGYMESRRPTRGSVVSGRQQSSRGGATTNFTT